MSKPADLDRLPIVCELGDSLRLAFERDAREHGSLDRSRLAPRRGAVLALAMVAAVATIGGGVLALTSRVDRAPVRHQGAPLTTGGRFFPELDRPQSTNDRVGVAPHGVDLRSVRVLPSPLEGWKFWIARSTAGEVDGDGVCLLWLDPEAAKIASGPGGVCQPIARVSQGVLATSSAGQSDRSRSRVLWLVPRGSGTPRIDASDGSTVALYGSGSLRVSALARLSGASLTLDGHAAATGFSQQLD